MSTLYRNLARQASVKPDVLVGLASVCAPAPDEDSWQAEVAHTLARRKDLPEQVWELFATSRNASVRRLIWERPGLTAEQATLLIKRAPAADLRRLAAAGPDAAMCDALLAHPSAQKRPSIAAELLASGALSTEQQERAFALVRAQESALTEHQRELVQAAFHSAPVSLHPLLLSLEDDSLLLPLLDSAHGPTNTALTERLCGALLDRVTWVASLWKEREAELLSLATLPRDPINEPEVPAEDAPELAPVDPSLLLALPTVELLPAIRERVPAAVAATADLISLLKVGGFTFTALSKPRRTELARTIDAVIALSQAAKDAGGRSPLSPLGKHLPRKWAEQLTRLPAPAPTPGAVPTIADLRTELGRIKTVAALDAAIDRFATLLSSSRPGSYYELAELSAQLINHPKLSRASFARLLTLVDRSGADRAVSAWRKRSHNDQCLYELFLAFPYACDPPDLLRAEDPATLIERLFDTVTAPGYESPDSPGQLRTMIRTLASAPQFPATRRLDLPWPVLREQDLTSGLTEFVAEELTALLGSSAANWQLFTTVSEEFSGSFGELLRAVPALLA